MGHDGEARHGRALGFGSAVDKDLDEDEYTTAEDDPMMRTGPAVGSGRRFFDSYSLLWATTKKKPVSRKAGGVG